MANTLRAFIAVPVPDAVTAFLKRIQDRLRPRMADVRWVAADNIHLTLAFLGDIAPAMLSSIQARVDAAAGAATPFSLTARSVGVFPNLRQARVLWVGLEGDLEALGVLQNQLESGLASLGFQRENRPFRAHLTIGRTRRRLDPGALGAALEPLKAETSGSFGADQIRIYQSVLKPAGAEYTVLHQASLGGGSRRTTAA